MPRLNLTQTEHELILKSRERQNLFEQGWEAHEAAVRPILEKAQDGDLSMTGLVIEMEGLACPTLL